MDEYLLKQLSNNIYDLNYQIRTLVAVLEKSNILDSVIRDEAVQVINVN